MVLGAGLGREEEEVEVKGALTDAAAPMLRCAEMEKSRRFWRRIGAEGEVRRRGRVWRRREECTGGRRRAASRRRWC
jgi:hypothetical protein